MKLFIRLVFLLCMGIAPVVLGQKKTELDSLAQVLRRYTKPDSNRVRVLNRLCWAHRNGKLIEAVTFGKEAVVLAKQLAFVDGEAEGLNYLGVVYRNMGDFTEASNRFYEALAVSEKHLLWQQIAYSNNNIGDILKFQKKYLEALPYTEKALTAFKKLKDEKGQGFAYVRLGEIYQGLAIYDKAVEAYQKSLKIRERIGDASSLSTSYNRVGHAYRLNKEYDKALEYYQKGLGFAKKSHEERVIAGCLYFLAMLHIDRRQYEEAKDYALQSLAMAQRLEARLEERDAYFALAYIAESSQNFADALEYHKKFMALGDSIDNLEKSNQLAKMQVIYDTKKKDQENDMLKREQALSRMTIGLMVTGGLLAFLVGAFFYRNRQIQNKEAHRLKQKNEALVFLGKHPHIQKGDWEEALELICRTVAQTLSLQRVSIWRYFSRVDDRLARLACIQLHDTERPQCALETMAKNDYPRYFEMVTKQDNIIAGDVAKIDFLAELVQKQFEPLSIVSAAHIPIFSEEALWGVLCAEQRRQKRKWNSQDTAFLKSVVDLTTIAYQAYQRKKAEAELQKQYEKVMELNATIERKKAKIERHTALLLELSKNPAIANGDWAELGKEVTKAIVAATEADVSQLWYFNFKEEVFYNIGHCSTAQDAPNAPIVLPIFTKLLEAEHALAVADLETDTQLDEASRQFFLQQGAKAVILYPNILSEQQKGVLTCCARQARHWDVEDIALMKSMDDETMIAYQGYRRQQAQERIEKQSKEIAEKNESLRTTLRLVKREQKRTDELLFNILPFEIAEELRSSGSATPRHYELVTVLFTDLKGFTKIAETLSPQTIIEELNTCFLAFDEICERYNLEKIKTIGDAYMCAGGVPVANQTNPVDAVNAALAMQAWMQEWTQTKNAKGEQAWEIRIGIHSGEVVAGVVGKKKFAYDIWGDTVNTAARMESSGEIGKINISGATYELVKHQFQCVFRGKVQAKNKGEIDMYFVNERMDE